MPRNRRGVTTIPRNGSGVYSKPAGTTAVPNTTIESAKYNSTIDDIVDDLNAARPVTAGGTGQTSVPAARQAFTTYTTKSAGYTAAKTDAGAIHRCSAELTVSLTAATTLGANWTLTIIADGGDVTIDADGTELINGMSTFVVPNGSATYFICTGSAFVAVILPKIIRGKGADIASASALVLGNDGDYFDVTGTTAITSINSVGVGARIKLHFDGVLTLTHHSTDLILPGGANITTAAGDEAEFVEYAAGDWRCVNYQRANGSPPLIVGAVSQSGGVPTGQIIERGSNANGDYVRYADGTQICWRRDYQITLAADTTTTGSWPFPAAFVDAPATFIGLDRVSTTNSFIFGHLLVAGSATAGTVRVRMSAAQQYFFNLMAVGRWF